ncbi:unnamed protein product [Ambrosiozyma monospora]|uniref:Unnamed protein product n=1 Tax=Ambrosiozyma monospora TaxID=43982 RepID=A0ACB5T1C4_AMBMO|nr:unnamed protein product [Ambrosiozyma monospora]
MTEELTQATKDLSLEKPTAATTESKKDVTVLESKKDFTVKHPLNSKWTLWYTKPQVDRNESWSDLLRPVVSFETVEEFWGIFNAVPKANELPLKSDYHLFRDDIKPEWEDKANSKGGKWSFQFRGKNANVDINEVWVRALLSVIGETIEDEEHEVNGVVLSIRKGVSYRIGLWTKSCNPETLKPIGERLKVVLMLGDHDRVEFSPHNDGDRSSSFFV